MFTETEPRPVRAEMYATARPTPAPRERLATLSAANRLVLWLFYAYLLAAPFFSFSLLNSGSRGWLRIDWIVAILLVGAAIFEFAAGLLPLRYSPIHLPVCLVAYSALLSILFLLSPHTNTSQFIDYATKAAQLALALPFFFAISSLPLTRQDLVRVLRLWIGVALVVSAFAVYQVFAIALGWPFAQLSFNNLSVTYQGGEARVIQGFGQVSSFFREPSYLGAFLLPVIIFTMVFLLKGRSQQILTRSKLLNWGVFAVLCSAFLFTSSQAAYLSLAVVILAMLVFPYVGRIQVTRLILALAVLGLAAGVILSFVGIDFFGALFLRFKYLVINMLYPAQTMEVTSYRVRSECMLAALQVWMHSPIIGVGLNNMSHLSNTCEFSLGWTQLLADQGLLGVITLALTLGLSMFKLAQMAIHRATGAFWATTCLAMTFVLAGETINGFFTYNWVDLQRWINLALANLVLILAMQASKLAPSESQQTGQLPDG